MLSLPTGATNSKFALSLITFIKVFGIRLKGGNA